MLGPPTPEPLLAGRVPVVVVGWHVDHPAGRRGPHLGRARHGGSRWITWSGWDIGGSPISTAGASLIAASRRAGYLGAMASARAGRRTSESSPAARAQLDGQRAARPLLEQGGPLPTALIAYNDDTAVAAMGVLAQQGIVVPGQTCR